MHRGLAADRAAKEIKLVANAERLPVPLQGDPTRLAQVLDNLVSNALKFTPAGGRVDVRLSAADGVALLEVQDTGLGLAEDEQQQLFERFFRSSRASENAIPGTGLGLAIAKTIVERHGGRIELESAVDVGTTVRVELPLSLSERGRTAARTRCLSGVPSLGSGISGPLIRFSHRTQPVHSPGPPIRRPWRASANPCAEDFPSDFSGG